MDTEKDMDGKNGTAEKKLHSLPSKNIGHDDDAATSDRIYCV